MNEMPPAAHSLVYLYAAYAVVWVIHCVYAFSLVSRGKRIRREEQELHRH
jgi:CcmD family protein